MNRLCWLRGAFAICCLMGLLPFLAPPAAWAADPTTPRKGITIEGITEYQLGNGLRFLLFPDESSSNVTVNLTALVGSRHEGYGETGMAHLLEHMLFKGTPTHPNVPKVLAEHGARFNGTTWVDRTNYYETMPATDENLEFGIRLEADRLVNSFVKREDLLSEMTVVRNEFEAGENNPQYVLSQRMMSAAYEWHNYGKSTIGNRSDIERVPIERLQAFYHKYYQPDNVVLVVAGKFDEAKALAYAGKYLGVLKRPERRLDTTYTEEPAQDGERLVTLRRVGKVGLTGAVYHIPAAAHPDFAAVEVLNSLLVSEPAGRLYEMLVAGKKASSVSGSANGWHDPGVLEFFVEVSPQNSLEGARDAMVDVLEGVAHKQFTAEEVERAKRRLLKNRELLMTNSNHIGITISDWAAKGDWRLFFLHRDRLEKVSPADVARVAERYLQRNNRTVGLYIPADAAQRAAIPETPPVAALLQDYKGGEAVTAGEAFDPTPENIEKRVQRSTLPSGVQAALLPKKSRGEVVALRLTLRFGNEESLREQTTAADFLGSLMTRGTSVYNRQQLQDELDKLKARLSVSSGAGQVSAHIECKHKNLPAVLHLLGEVLRHPTFPEDEFDILKRQKADTLKAALAEPTSLAQNALRRKLAPFPADNIRYVPTLEEDIARLQAVTATQVRNLYAAQLGGTHGELAVVGDFDPENTLKLVADALKDWKSTVPYHRIEHPAQVEVRGERMAIETPDKANAIYVAAHALAMTDSDPDYAALEVADYLFGGASLASRMADRVRQKEGLSYGVGAHFSADSLDKNAAFLMYAICNPTNIDKVDAAIADELRKLLKDGVQAQELTDAVKGYLQSLKVGRASEGQLASQLVETLHAGRTFAYYGDQEKQVAALTPEQVSDAFRRHIRPEKLIIIRAGDFKGGKRQE